MCNQATDDKICDNLAAMAITTTVDPSFGEWLRDVELSLQNKAAIAHRSNLILYGCYKDGLTPSLVAERLDETFVALQPQLFTVEKVTA